MLRGCLRTAWQFAMAVLGLILLLCGAEVAVRLAEVRQQLQQTDRSLSANPSRRITVPSWTTYTQLPPMSVLRPEPVEETGLTTDHRIEINRLGYRGPVHSTSPNRTSYRVLVLGDESLFGAALPEDALATQQLAQSLATSRSGPIEIINGSWPAATPTMQLIALRTHWASLAPQLVVLQVSRQRFERESRLRRFVRLDSTGLPAACPHPSLSAAANHSTLKTCQQHFRVLNWMMSWGGATWQQSVEERETDRETLANEELLDTPWRLTSDAWQQWSRQTGIPVVLLATPTAAERAEKQQSTSPTPHWLKIALNSATEHNWGTCVAGQQRGQAHKARSRIEALTQWQTLVATSLEDSLRQQMAGPWNRQTDSTQLAAQPGRLETQTDHGYPQPLPINAGQASSATTAQLESSPVTGGQRAIFVNDARAIEPTSYREPSSQQMVAPAIPRPLPTADGVAPQSDHTPQAHHPPQQGANRGRTLKPRDPSTAQQYNSPPR